MNPGRCRRPRAPAAPGSPVSPCGTGSVTERAGQGAPTRPGDRQVLRLPANPGCPRAGQRSRRGGLVTEGHGAAWGSVLAGDRAPKSRGDDGARGSEKSARRSVQTAPQGQQQTTLGLPNAEPEGNREQREGRRRGTWPPPPRTEGAPLGATSGGGGGKQVDVATEGRQSGRGSLVSVCKRND